MFKILIKSVSTLWLILINTILWIILLPTLTLPLLIATFIRQIVNLVAKKSNLIPLSPNDILLIRGTPSVQPVASGGLILRIEGKVDFPKFKLLFNQLFLTPEDEERYLNFRCDIVNFGGFLFKRIIENCDFEKQFVHKDVDYNSNTKEILAQWFQQKNEEGQPLWQVLYLNCSEDTQSFLAIKGHHGLMDGYSFVHILDKLTGISSPCLSNSNEDKAANYWREVLLFLSLPKVSLTYVLRHFWVRDTFPKLHKLNHPSISMLPMSFGTVDLQPIKAIRRHLKVHFPSIVFSLQVGTIRRVLLSLDPSHDVSKVTLLSTSFPIPRHPQNTLTNHWSGGTIKIPLREESAKNRLLSGDKSFLKMTGDEGPYLIWKYVSYLTWLMPCRLNYWMSFSNLSLYRYKCSMSCIPQNTNQEYRLMGLKVKNIYHAPVMKDCFPQAVMLGCSSSHNDQVDLTLFGHPELFPDQKKMDEAMHIHLRQELEDLLNQCELDLSLNSLNFRE